MVGRGVALGVGVVVTVALGKSADGLVLGIGDVGRSAGEVMGEEPGADGEQAAVRTRRESAAMPRRISRPYVRYTATAY
jgi:hypothetical protein